MKEFTKKQISLAFELGWEARDNKAKGFRTKEKKIILKEFLEMLENQNKPNF